MRLVLPVPKHMWLHWPPQDVGLLARRWRRTLLRWAVKGYRPLVHDEWVEEEEPLARRATHRWQDRLFG